MKDIIFGENGWDDIINQNFHELIRTINRLSDGTISLDNNDENIIAKLDDLQNQVNQLSNPNLLINGDFINPINQRNKKIYTKELGTLYTIDRWNIQTNGEGSATINSDCIELKITKATSTGDPVTCLNFATSLDLDDIKALVGKKLTLSFKLKNKTNKVCQIWCHEYGSSDGQQKHYFHYGYDWNTSKSDGSLYVNGDRDMFSKTFTLTENTLNNKYIEFGIQIEGDVGTSIQLEYGKLEIGDKATPFVPRSYTEELALCKRYYFRNRWISTRVASINTETVRTISYSFPVEMRVPPTVKIIIEQPIDWIGVYNDGGIRHPTLEQIHPVELRMYNRKMCDFQFNHALEPKDYTIEIYDDAYEFDAEIY